MDASHRVALEQARTWSKACLDSKEGIACFLRKPFECRCTPQEAKGQLRTSLSLGAKVEQPSICSTPSADCRTVCRQCISPPFTGEPVLSDRFPFFFPYVGLLDSKSKNTALEFQYGNARALARLAPRHELSAIDSFDAPENFPVLGAWRLMSVGEPWV